MTLVMPLQGGFKSAQEVFQAFANAAVPRDSLAVWTVLLDWSSDVGVDGGVLSQFLTAVLEMLVQPLVRLVPFFLLVRHA